ncbi:MAG: sphingosine kinase [Hyphomicrobiales bacterium]|nr:sphingosine kinase [Hyphomicrobiales bacterium]
MNLDLRITFILNGKSGSCNAAEVSQQAKRLASEKGAVATLHILDAGSDIEAFVKGALNEGAGIVVAGGGDGTISAVAGALSGSDVPLGVLPLGTLNHFAKDLNIPLGLDDALANIFVGTHRLVDLGEVNGRVFINNSGVGLYPHIVRDRESMQKHGYPKWLALAQAAIRKVRNYSLMRVSLRTNDGQKLTRSTPFVFVGNNKFEMSGPRMGARERIDGGKLWICLAPEAGRLKLAALAALALVGRLRERDLVAFEATDVEIATRRHHQQVSHDGEVSLMNTPLHYRCRPLALRVIVPAAVAKDVAAA